MEKMDKKEIQRQRMMKYFIEAGKQIILEEGVKNVTVRKVADLAGYSYATLYNYFEDLSALLYHCGVGFLDECCEYVKNAEKPCGDDKQRVKNSIMHYARYFIQFPQQFQLLFIENMGSEPPEEIASAVNQPEVARALAKILWDYGNEIGLTAEEAAMLVELIGGYVHGKLLFYIKRTQDKEDGKFLECMGQELEYLLEAVKRSESK